MLANTMDVNHLNSESSEQMLSISVRRGASMESHDETVIAGTRNLKSGSDVQMVRVMENHEAFIRTGESRLHVNQIQTNVLGGQNVGLGEQSIETGFWVKPRVTKDGMIHLKIRIKKEAPVSNDSQAIAKSGLETTLLVPRGQWTLVGGSGGDEQSDAAISAGGDTISLRKASGVNGSESIWIKVN